MEFNNLIKQYISELNCTCSDLGKASHLSNSTISRYYNGTRKPANPSDELTKLINGLVLLYKNKKIIKSRENIKQELDKVLINYNTDKIIDNFNTIIEIIRFNIADFSKRLGYDPSHLSRIRSKKRKLSNPDVFLNAVSDYIITNYYDSENLDTLSSLFNCSVDLLTDKARFKTEIINWFCSDYKNLESNNIKDFLNKLNDFNLNEYIKVIKFNEVKVLSVPFIIPKSKNYYGLEEMKQGELDFLKSTVLSKNSKNVFMCSDMQMNDMSNDLDFGKKWMFGLAMVLKKGLNLNIIHNIDRPFDEMMVGLESWIPLYMTGQISPYYLPNTKNGVYSHLDYVSDDFALTGECLKGFHSKGKYYLTNNKKEVHFYQDKAKNLLKKAKPLMTMYRSNNKIDFERFLNNDYFNTNKIKIMTSSLPIYTIEDSLLEKILKNNNISENDIEKILEFTKNQKNNFYNFSKNHQIEFSITKYNKKEYNSYPVILDLSKMFFDKKIQYTYEEYLKHYKQTEEFISSNKNYSIVKNDMAFRNIQIELHSNQWVMISKNNNPTIHFVIKHPTLCKAIEKFTIPIIES